MHSQIPSTHSIWSPKHVPQGSPTLSSANISQSINSQLIAFQYIKGGLVKLKSEDIRKKTHNCQLVDTLCTLITLTA